MTTTIRRAHACVATLLAGFVAIAPAAHAARVQLFAQPPMDVETGAFDLDDLERYNQTPVFQQTFAIPYATLEERISDELRRQVDRTMSGKIVCDDPCPDVDYRVSAATSFAFTQPNQPVIESFGNADENGVTVRLDAQAWVRLDVVAAAETWFHETGDIHAPIEVLLGLHATASAKLWPVVDVSAYDVHVTLDGSNVEIQGLDGTAVELGAKLGTFLGFTPLGLFTGGPIGGAILGIIGAGAAADAAEAEIKRLVAHRLEQALQQANGMLQDRVAAYIVPAVAQANDVKGRILGTPLPGVGKSLAELQNEWGLQLDVRTHVEDQTVRTVATTRFSAAPAGGALSGRLRMPKTACVYGEISHPIIGHVKLPMDVQNHNLDLQPLVGMPCSGVFGGGDLGARVYLGADPEPVLASGHPANSLPTWADAGTVTFTGSLTEQAGYYECTFTVTDLPAVGIEELAVGRDVAARITELHPATERVMHLAGVPYGLGLLNSELLPYGWKGLAIGGKGPDSKEDCPTEMSSGTGWQKNFDFDYAFDPETCPQCGLEPYLGARDEVIYVITNPEAFLETIAGEQVQIDAPVVAMPEVEAPAIAEPEVMAPEVIAPEVTAPGDGLAPDGIGAEALAPWITATTPWSASTSASPAASVQNFSNVFKRSFTRMY